MIEPGLVKIKGDLFDLQKILKLLDRAGRSVFYRSEEKLIVLVARLIRVQQQWLTELQARVVFLETECRRLDITRNDYQNEMQRLQGDHAELMRRYDAIMARHR